MRGVVWTRYGAPDVLEVRDLPRPVPTDDEVLIRVVATTVTSAESGMRQGQPRWGRVILGLTRPRKRMRVMGLELAGVVEAVGAEVRRFRVGDEVFGFTGFRLGADAEYAVMPDKGSLALKPVDATFEESAAAVDGASTALYFLRDKARVRTGQKVLVLGAAGSIGTYAVQLANHLGAEVTGVCGPGNVDLVRSLGAHHVIDYTVEDFTANGEKYDVIFDSVTKSSFSACRDSLTATGCYLPTTGLRNSALALWTAVRPGQRVRTGMSVEKKAALVSIKDMIEAGELTVVIDRVFPLEDIAEAHRYVDAGHKRGNVVISVAPVPQELDR